MRIKHPQLENNIILYNHDIPDGYLNFVIKSKIVAWDIETSGLDWRNDRIGLCQLYTPGKSVVIIRIDNTPPKNLSSLLSNPQVKKVFHHALFDLRFMCYRWRIIPQNIACTKIAAKLLDRENKNSHTLQSLLLRYLNITIDKTEQTSNWLSKQLTKEQIVYAATDVLYLPSLLNVLERELESKKLLKLAQECFAFIPTKVQLDILGYSEIYNYGNEPKEGITNKEKKQIWSHQINITETRSMYQESLNYMKALLDQIGEEIHNINEQSWKWIHRTLKETREVRKNLENHFEELEQLYVNRNLLTYKLSLNKAKIDTLKLFDVLESRLQDWLELRPKEGGTDLTKKFLDWIQKIKYLQGVLRNEKIAILDKLEKNGS